MKRFFFLLFVHKKKTLYQPAEVLTHEEGVNAGRYESLFGAPPPANPARNTNPA